MQELIAKEVEAVEEGVVSYEIQWIIPNWREVRKDVSLVRNQQATFETGPEEYQTIQTKWLVGLKDVGGGGDFDIKRMARVYWQLLDVKGSVSSLKLEATTCTQLCNSDGIPEVIDEEYKEVSLCDVIERRNEYLDIGTNIAAFIDKEYINSNGAVQYTLRLSFKKPVVDSARFKKLKMEIFSKRSHSQLSDNFAALLNEDSHGDLKIITSDGVELRAYQSILKVQCPVFAGMLNSDCSESKTGVLKVDDISGKTMRILLHYFYAGDLLNGWSDPDTIVEFTYAAGKYQITQVLELLDGLLGRSDQGEVSSLDVELLNLTGKLALKNAETRLLQRIIDKVAAAKSGKELIKLFGGDSKEINRRAEKLAGEPIEMSKVLETLDYVFGNASQQVDFSHRGLILLALVEMNGSLSALEQILLKQVSEITSKLSTADELFAFFGDGKLR